MRKQTKLVAVLSTAALLALGASMSSFAATGWQEENGTWVYYDKNGDKETEKWEKSGDNWFYLNDDGEMATDVVVEYNDNYYYVDENGSMVTNKWVSIENEDYDGNNEDEPANHWYYFGSNGKAFKGSASASTAVFKSVNGKKYIFDDEGKMLYGWINAEGTRETGDDKWQNAVYYCGDENDGAQSLGWKSLDIVDNNYEDDDNAGISSSNVFDDENQTRWFYFNTNGKKYVSKDAKTINGKKYSFDKYGRMNAEWIIYDATPTLATNATADITATYGSADYTSNWRYYGSPEDGARVTKGWFKVVPDYYLHTSKYNDDEDSWYYSDRNGKLVADKIETVNGKKYAFDEFGRMKSGLLFIKFEGTSKTKIASILADDNDANPFDTEDNFKKNAPILEADGYFAYYFGGGEDGAMKTNKQNISIDGDSFTFLLNKSGGYKGAGKTGVDNKKYYQSGMMLAASKDDKYSVVKEYTETGDAGSKTVYTLLTTDDFLDDANVHANEDTTKSDKYTTYKNITFTGDAKFYLVNTSGSVQKNKTKAKDGNDRCYKVANDGTIEAIYEEN
ncbi:cell wall-binding protein [Lacrimispora xylanolytica]|uniref:Cell wall-binding protein n=1 Tax=Lacrimispora xylanolytica TaxID=29375 RepID=A0ABY7ADJ5_9FIRM|nr:cell wall-binding protein [Lacrimispora xylanolytica]WAJ24542.1 cell wall-binding protein [Lacrimispora xylanolytica]